MRQSATDITALYVPQFKQFDLELKNQGAVFTGDVSNDRARGRAWVMPLSSTCLVMEHYIIPKNDMNLLEYTPEPYACVSEISASTLACMPEAGITPANLQPLHGSQANNAICSFIQDTCGEEHSPLFAEQLYHSRSVLFLPGYFKELESLYPSEFNGLFDAFAEPWQEEAASVIRRTLSRIDEGRASATGGHLYMRGVVDAMVAELARTATAAKQAQQALGTRESGVIVAKAIAAIEQALNTGACISLNELAEILYVSRSKLCATFKAETGESVGAFMRRRRLERAQDALANSSLSMAQIARQLGFPQQAAFTQAFKQATGLSPTAWRAKRQ